MQPAPATSPVSATAAPRAALLRPGALSTDSCICFGSGGCFCTESPSTEWLRGGPILVPPRFRDTLQSAAMEEGDKMEVWEMKDLGLQATQRIAASVRFSF